HGDHLDPPSSPTRRSSDLTNALADALEALLNFLERAQPRTALGQLAAEPIHLGLAVLDRDAKLLELTLELLAPGRRVLFARAETDRKSTRLNSSHVKISYA